MIERLLRRFCPSLEEALQVAESAVIKAQDESRYWRAKSDAAEEARVHAQAEVTDALKKVSNWQAMMTGAPAVPFPESYTPPPAPAPTNGAPTPMPMPGSMRDLQRQAILKSRIAAYERMKAARGDAE